MILHKKIIIYSLYLYSFSMPQTGFSDNVSFFKGNIDYWSKEKTPTAVTAPLPALKSAGKVEELAPKSNFDWNKVMDPKNDEFFKEGDYTPPAPFMEMARNPSDENIRMWRAYIEKKNLLAQRLDMRLQEFAGKGQQGVVTTKQLSASEPTMKSEAAFDRQRYQFRIYFDSQCPHCQNMMGTMKELALKGAVVEAKQIDDGPFNAGGLPFQISRATPEDVKSRGITSVPFLLVGDLKKKVVYKLGGYKTVSSIFEEINATKKN